MKNDVLCKYGYKFTSYICIVEAYILEYVTNAYILQAFVQYIEIKICEYILQ